MADRQTDRQMAFLKSKGPKSDSNQSSSQQNFNSEEIIILAALNLDDWTVIYEAINHISSTKQT